MNILPPSFYQRPDVLQISRELLGKYLFTDIEGSVAGGMIVETEAYAHQGDLAIQSHLKRRNVKKETMFRAGGIAYVYRVYRIHSLFNIVTNVQGKPDAVLVRAIEPILNVEAMQQRRGLDGIGPRLTAGPGMLTQALGITPAHSEVPITTGESIWIEDRGERVEESAMLASPRVGIQYAGEDALLPWRLRIRDNEWTSKAK
uniref:Putative 3-methyladenine DNA glycosylase n=1 Tax=Roseihalotalea indica TaxID=2867963 RepID=A0AA49JK74_9BACT|nr:DNA-3-methyladenine glycosylase [Tunicatimonas sp. TK19036]